MTSNVPSTIVERMALSVTTPTGGASIITTSYCCRKFAIKSFIRFEEINSEGFGGIGPHGITVKSDPA